MTHTKGKLKFHWQSNDGHHAKAVCSDPSMHIVFPGFDLSAEQRRDIVRRMKAAWNAVEGYPTETLEVLVSLKSSMLEQMNKKDARITTLLDALRAAVLMAKTERSLPLQTNGEESRAGVAVGGLCSGQSSVYDGYPARPLPL